LLAFAVRWARQAGEFEARDIARGAGALVFLGFGTVAVLQFARLLTGAQFGYLEQRFLLAQVTRWEWAVMLTSLGVMLIAAAELSRTRKWVVLLPITAGLACALHLSGPDLIGLVRAWSPAPSASFVLRQAVNRKGAWAGILILGWILARWCRSPPRRGLCAGLAAADRRDRGGGHGALRAGARSCRWRCWRCWPRSAWAGRAGCRTSSSRAGPDAAVRCADADGGLRAVAAGAAGPGRSPSRFIGILVLAGGLALTLIVRSADPWTPRHPLVTYVGYQLDQDTASAWRFAYADDPALDRRVLAADGGHKARCATGPGGATVAAPARRSRADPPAIALLREPDGSCC
jgi:hypothetical protein